MVKRFFLKSALLITLLFCAVLYGMDLAKQGMMKMEGTQTSHSTSPLNFDHIPGLGNNQPEKAQKQESANAATATKAEPQTDDLSSRITKLDQIHSFNPYSAMGDKLSDGVSSVFEHGIQATASVLGHLLN